MAAVLEDTEEHPMVRHEAAEALGSIATDDCLPVLEKFLKDKEVCTDSFGQKNWSCFRFAYGVLLLTTVYLTLRSS